MSFTSIILIFIFILITGLIVSAIYDVDLTQNEGFKSKKPQKPVNIIKEIGKIGKFFKYLGKWFKWLGDIMKCTIESIIGLPNCIMFYLFDLFIGTIGVIIKLLCSFSPTLTKARKTTWNIVKKLDKMVYGVTGFHIIEYPKSILKKCYKCKNKKMPKM